MVEAFEGVPVGSEVIDEVDKQGHDPWTDVVGDRIGFDLKQMGLFICSSSWKGLSFSLTCVYVECVLCEEFVCIPDRLGC